MKNPVPTIRLNIPRENAKVMHDRISVFIDMYHEQQRVSTLHFYEKTGPEFDLKALCYSCYLQGLADAKEAMDTQK